MGDQTMPTDPGRRARLEAAMAEYLLAADAGAAPGREEFLARHPELRAELEAFLADQSAVGHLVREAAPVDPGATAAWESGAAPVGPTTEPGGEGLGRGEAVRYFGDYEVRRELGRGGMGIVYEARQVSLNRPVALKMLRAGLLADADELRRFKNEAEAAATLDHPGIVPVHEVGEHEGQRYFSMKLVEGGSLVPLLPQYQDDPRAAARLVMEAAEAVAHAHARGILHRDLKPANVLVDDAGHPHVTDFGLAKRVDDVDGEQTASGAILGTPAYMSPEQASGRRGSITTATDVYGLGAILYALLTGRAPFGGESVVETLEAVRERAPEPPTRVNAKAPRDLETICLKCLAKEPRRRYATAQAVADDLRAWLESRPIAARRVGVGERAWLWCKRRPAVAALSGATVLAIVGGAGATIAVQARGAADLRRQLDATRVAEAEANRWLDRAMEAIRDYHSGFAADAITGETVPREVRERLLARPLEFYDRLTGELAAKEAPSDRERFLLAQGRFELCRLLLALGRGEAARREGDGAVAAYASLADDHPEEPAIRDLLARTLNASAAAREQLGDLEGGRVELERALAIGEALLAESPEERNALDSTAHTLMNLGLFYQKVGDSRAAAARLTQSVGYLERLVARWPDQVEYVKALASASKNLGVCLSEAGADAGARAPLERAVGDYERLIATGRGGEEAEAALAMARMNLGVLRLRSGEEAAARELLEAAARGYEGLASRRPGVPMYRVSLGLCLMNLGPLRQESEAALADLRRGVELFESLNKAGADHREDLGGCLANLATVERRRGRLEEARGYAERAVATFAEAGVGRPATASRAREMALMRTTLGTTLLELGELGGARREYEAAIGLLDAWRGAGPGLARELAEALETHAVILANSGDLAGARSGFARLASEHEGLLAAEPDRIGYRVGLAHAWMNLGAVCRALGELDASESATGRAAAEYEALAASQPEVAEHRNALAMCLSNLGTSRWDRGDKAAAVGLFERSIAALEGVVARWPDAAEYRSSLALSRLNLGRTLTDEPGRAGEACRVLERALEEYEGLAAARPEAFEYRLGVARARSNLGRALAAAGDAAGAAASTRKAIAAFEALAARQPGVVMHVLEVCGCEQRLGEALEATGDPTGTREAYDRALARYEALLASRGLAGDRALQIRYRAACVAALAGRPAGSEEDAARGRYRERARAWLEAELGEWERVVEQGGAEGRAAAGRMLRHWQGDADLAGVRGEGIEALPGSEREGWRALWGRVEEVRGIADSG